MVTGHRPAARAMWRMQPAEKSQTSQEKNHEKVISTLVCVALNSSAGHLGAKVTHADPGFSNHSFPAR